MFINHICPPFSSSYFLQCCPPHISQSTSSPGNLGLNPQKAKLNTYFLPAQNSTPSRLHQVSNINPGTLKLLEDKARSMSQRLFKHR